jgi:hypothetical protein
MKDYKFCFLLFLLFSVYHIAQSDYNKVDEKKMGLEGFYVDSKDLDMRGLSIMEKK